MDGNRRWARSKGLPAFDGHRLGYEKIKEVGKWCKTKGIKVLTVWAFSTDNWNRSKEEVDYLMNLLGMALSKKEIEWLNEENIRVRVIGQKERLAKNLQKAIREAEKETKKNTEGLLNIAISYGGRDEIVDGIRKILAKRIKPEKVNEDLVTKNLWTKGLPLVDLIIRTSGELRTSGFMLWHSPYSELHFCKKYWPDFQEPDLDAALEDFGKRKRNFGK